MKARLDFVSNSSSSSFMLVGDVFDSHSIVEGWRRLNPDAATDKEGIEDDEDFDDYELVEEIAEKLDLSYERGIDVYYDHWVLGLPFDKMDDNETKKQFIDRITKSLQKVFPGSKATAIVDGGYNG